LIELTLLSLTKPKLNFEKLQPSLQCFDFCPVYCEVMFTYELIEPRLERVRARHQRAYRLDILLECEAILRDLIRDRSVTPSQQQNYQTEIESLRLSTDQAKLLQLRVSLRQSYLS
jgi:hypothetical protein